MSQWGPAGREPAQGAGFGSTWRAADGRRVRVAIRMDTFGMSPAEVRRYVAELSDLLDPATRAPVALRDDPGSSEAVAGQLDRLCRYAVANADRLRRLHDALCGLGCSPRMPRSGAHTPPPYLSYLGADGQNLGYLRSSSFTVVRRDLVRRVLELPEARASGTHALLGLGSDEAAQALVEAAREVLL